MRKKNRQTYNHKERIIKEEDIIEMHTNQCEALLAPLQLLVIETARRKVVVGVVHFVVPISQ
jgi:hypothetical protein